MIIRTIKLAGLASLICCLFFTQPVQPRINIAQGPFKIKILKDVMVGIRDSVMLATDVYLPYQNNYKTDDRFPAILVRTSYSKNRENGTAIYRAFASFGYVVVAQDTRGRYNSEGVWHMLTDDGRDGYDTAEWIVSQPWSNGKIGMWGMSYDGGTQHAAALEKAPGLVTVIPVDAMSNMGTASIRNAGAFELRFWNWIYCVLPGSRQARNPGIRRMFNDMIKNKSCYLGNLPLRRGTTPLKVASEYEEWLVEAMCHGANDSFWEQNDIIHYSDQYKDIPVYLVGGWYDSWGSNTTANFKELSKSIKGPVYLIMGPWTHDGSHAEYYFPPGRDGYTHGQVCFGHQAMVHSNTMQWLLAWFDHWLKGLDNDVGKADPFTTKVRIFVMGTGDGHKTESGFLYHGGYWRNEHEWPLARTRYTPYFLHGHGRLDTQSPSEKMLSTSFTFDPRNPVPTIGGNISSGSGLMLQGAWDQRGGEHIWNWTDPIPLSVRNDVVVFQTDPLPEDLEVTGEITVNIWASSSALDTDFTAKLIDVYPPNEDYPDGFDLNIGDGIIRARFRDSFLEEKLMQPGNIYPFTIKLYPTSNIFKKGHRIRVDISSSNYPRFDVNPNTGEPLNNHRRMEIAINKIFYDKEHPSHIILPVIPKM